MELPDKDETKTNQEQGLYGKYRVERVDGKERGPYFVLDIVHDPIARHAFQYYADEAEDKYPQLAADMRRMLKATFNTYKELHAK